MDGRKLTCVVYLLLPLLLNTSIVSAENKVGNAQLNERYESLLKAGLLVEEFTVSVGDRKVSAIIVSPPVERLAKEPALLLTIGSPTSHLLPPYNRPANYFWERGHRVVCLSSRIPAGSLTQFKDEVMAGPDPTLQFIENARAVLDECLKRKWFNQNQIVVTGVSRYGYLAFRLMAADERFKIGGGFAPVTDWKDLAEFKTVKDRNEVSKLALTNYADKLTGKKLFFCIGSHDERVSTLSSCRFFLSLNQANAEKGFNRSLIDFYVTADPGHTCGKEWYTRGLETLLKAATTEKK